MNELNELDKKIFKTITQAEFDKVVQENYKDEIYSTQQLSKFFLEAIKEAWSKGQDAVEWNQLTGWKVNQTIDDYLKSKYKIVNCENGCDWPNCTLDKCAEQSYSENFNPDWKGDPDDPERWRGW